MIPSYSFYRQGAAPLSAQSKKAEGFLLREQEPGIEPATF